MQSSSATIDRLVEQAQCPCPSGGFHSAWDLEPCAAPPAGMECPLWQEGPRAGAPAGDQAVEENPEVWLG